MWIIVICTPAVVSFQTASHPQPFPAVSHVVHYWEIWETFLSLKRLLLQNACSTVKRVVEGTVTWWTRYRTDKFPPSHFPTKQQEKLDEIENSSHTPPAPFVELANFGGSLLIYGHSQPCKRHVCWAFIHTRGKGILWKSLGEFKEILTEIFRYFLDWSNTWYMFIKWK